jgi:hypothetical protein
MDAAADDARRGTSGVDRRLGGGPGRLTGWLVDWPAATLLNVIYALLTEHASAEQVDEIDAKLDAPIAGADGYDPARERHVVAALNGMFAATLT